MKIYENANFYDTPIDIYIYTYIIHSTPSLQLPVMKWSDLHKNLLTKSRN